jgi:hypothetical protein
MNPANVLILPGYGDSGPGHWQSLWEQAHGYTRVTQEDWLEPTRDAWVETLEAAVRAADSPVVLVAHSLACALVAHVAVRASAARIAGALLVAPADVESPDHTPEEVRSFAPLPLVRLPFPAIVVASADDAFVDLVRARHFAAEWRARLIELGAAGHINADAGFGAWPEGHRLLESLLR